MNNYKRLNNILGWVTFLIATIVYLVTMEPTGSFWDCGEFIATAYKLEVGHPPGAPMFMLLGRLFTMFGNSDDPASFARMANALSGIASGFTILFLFWTITAMGKKLFAVNKEELTQSNIWAIMGAGLVGALAYTFSDTFWFSAVEGEVYATSSMFTALVVWLILKWEQKVTDGDARADRYLVLIAYVLGIAIGVHLLNLLCIPAIAYIYYYRKYTPTRKGFVLAGVIGFALLLFFQYGIIPGFVTLASKSELFFVNSLGMGFNSGLIIYLMLISGLVVGGIVYTKRRGLVNWNTIFISLAVVLIGYSSYAVILIRSNAQTPMNENDPSNMFNLLSYINRDQYGDRPLFYGQYFNTPLDKADPYKDGNPVYYKDKKNGKYSVADDRKNSIPNYDSKGSTLFPRMWSAEHANSYRIWANIKGPKNKKPSMGQNLGFMVEYQMNHMWWRYFMWNFSGRQNDIQGAGGPLDGNFLTGIAPIDKARLGSQSDLPEVLANNKGKNNYYMLPLILGIIGLIFHIIKDNKRAWVVFLLFVFLGVLINVFLNPTPNQPRERDYAYVGSFYAYAIWVGFGVLGIYELLRKRTAQQTAAILATVLGVVAGPLLMAKENWDDHNRAHRFTSADFAKNYLDSCAPNAILFTNGDNDTFPLWYVQEVEGYRTDVRVVNLSLLNTDWYVDQMKRKAYNSEPVPFSLTQDEYRVGTRDAVLIIDKGEDSTYTDINTAMAQIKSKEVYTPPYEGAQGYHFFKSARFMIPVDKDKVVKNGTVPAELADQVAPIYWDINSRVLYKKDLMIIDLLASNNWERPVYFAITVGDDSYLGLEPYFQLEGLAYRVVPVRPQPQMDNQTGRVYTQKMYDNLINKFHWGNMADPNVYLDETNTRMTLNFRNNFARLAAALIMEDKRDLAKKTLDKCLEVMPDSTIPYNYFSLPIANLYFELGETKTANEIINRVKKLTVDELSYYNKLKPSLKKTVTSNIRRAEAVLRQINMIEGMMKTAKPGVNLKDTAQKILDAAQDSALPVDSPAKMVGTKQPTKPAGQ